MFMTRITRQLRPAVRPLVWTLVLCSSVVFLLYDNALGGSEREVVDRPLTYDDHRNLLWQPDDQPHQSEGTNVLIFTAHRSGSTFLGELFSKNPNSMYLFEPLKLMDIDDSYSTPDDRKALIQETLVQRTTELFQCNFDTLHDFSYDKYRQVFQYVNFWHFRVFKQLFVRAGITNVKNITYEKPIKIPATFIKSCMESKHKVIKTIRGHNLKYAWPLISPVTTKTKHNRIFYLVRDPRGVISSRAKLGQPSQLTPKEFLKLHKNRFVKDANQTCQEYAENLKFLHDLNSTTSFKVVRYEDLAYDPMITAEKIYAFANMTFMDTVKEWLMNATTASKSDFKKFGTLRDSQSTAEAWIEYLPYKMAKKIDELCSIPMEILGYKQVGDEDTYNSASVSYVSNSNLLYTL